MINYIKTLTDVIPLVMANGDVGSDSRTPDVEYSSVEDLTDLTERLHITDIINNYIKTLTYVIPLVMANGDVSSDPRIPDVEYSAVEDLIDLTERLYILDIFQFKEDGDGNLSTNIIEIISTSSDVIICNHYLR